MVAFLTVYLVARHAFLRFEGVGVAVWRHGLVISGWMSNVWMGISGGIAWTGSGERHRGTAEDWMEQI